MPPTPPPSPPIKRHIPPLHLQCLSLGHPGALRFFSHPDNPHLILARSTLTVLQALYPPELFEQDPSAERWKVLRRPRPANEQQEADIESDSSTSAGDEEISEGKGLDAMAGSAKQGTTFTKKEKDELPGPPAIRSVTLHVREFDGVAHTNGSHLDEQHKEIHLSTSYLAGVGGDKTRINQEIEGVIVHELVHVFQHNGKGTCNGGVIEGIADWVRLNAGLGPPHWRMGGNNWDEGYATTAFFLVFLSTYLSLPLLVPTLNLALRHREWCDGELLREFLRGEDVDELWKIYKKRIEDKGEVMSPAVPVSTHR